MCRSQHLFCLIHIKHLSGEIVLITWDYDLVLHIECTCGSLGRNSVSSMNERKENNQEVFSVM